MPTKYKQLIAHLLDYAADVLSNRSCNDLHIEDIPEHRELIEKAYRWSGLLADQDSFVPNIGKDGSLVTYDYLIMEYLAHAIEEQQ
jgi:hypothetical protein